MPNLLDSIAARIASLDTAFERMVRYSKRRETFMDQIDWHAMTQEDCNIASMEDEHIELSLFEIDCELACIASSYQAIQAEPLGY